MGSSAQRITLTLPWPISLNQMYFNRTSGKGRGRILTPEAKQWKTISNILIRATKGYRAGMFPKGTPVRVEYIFREPNGHLRDFDNLLKIINDSLQASGIIINDNQLRGGSFEFGERIPGGEVEVTLSVLE